MKICEAIRQTDELKPNQYSDEQKIRWLAELDGKIVKELIDAKSGEKSTAFEGYNEDTDTNTELLVPEPYSNLYVLWLMSKIDFFNAEYDRYNNSAMAFNEAYEGYWGYYSRTQAAPASGIFAR